MGLAKLLWIWTMAVFAVSSVAATVHKVGDSAGWTTLVPVDYAKWASSNNFHVGDSLSFSYNNKFHNVLQVNKQQYDSCNSSSPAASYDSGADSITLQRSGTFYFLCGFPGHCQVGQKVQIKVTSSKLLAPSSGPSPSPLPNGPAHVALTSVPAPSPSAASITAHLPHFFLLAYHVVAFYYLTI